MVFLDVSIVNLALPSIQRGLHMSQASLNYVVTACGTMVGGFLVVSGRLADTFGRRRMLQSGLLLFGAASLISGLAGHGATLSPPGRSRASVRRRSPRLRIPSSPTPSPRAKERKNALGIWDP
jgi:MFS family permease